MYGPHDLGGKHGLGPVDPEPESREPVFHSDWERRLFALTLATGMLGRWNIDESRHARERQHPIAYLSHSYYENWLEGVSKLLVEKGLLTRQELDSGRAAGPAPEDLPVPTPEVARKLLSEGGPTLMDATTAPLFTVGTRVRVRKNNSSGHTRAPAYVQGSAGVIERHWGCHVFPDSHATGEDRGEHLYSVRFGAESLWGAQSEPAEVLIDLWEPYLEQAQE